MPPSHAKRAESLQGIRAELAKKDFARDIRNYHLRQPYFEKYPQLLLLHNALFRIRYWYCLYGQDERDALFRLIPEQEIRRLLTRLQEDTNATITLSTYAINTFYLYEKLFPANQKALVDVRWLFDLKKHYDYTDKKDLQLLIYLYTHCIIGETLFYFQPISQRMDIYLNMLKEIEAIIANNPEDVHLDNKLEFLVCAALCGMESGLSPLIYAEAANLLTNEGFIIDEDKIDKRPDLRRQAFMLSEHTNALFIMTETEPLFLHSQGRSFVTSTD